MAGTADEFSTELPLDSPNWLPLPEEAYRLLCSLLGERNLAAKDLTDAMADDDDRRRVRSMRRCFAYGVREKIEYTGRVVDGFREVKAVGRERVLIGPERELLSREYWNEHRLSPRSDGSAEIIEGSGSITTVKGYAFFVWKPDLAKIWPTIFGPPSLSPPPQRSQLAELQPPKPQTEERGPLLRLPEEPQLSPEEPKKRWRPEDAKNWLVQMMTDHPPRANWNNWAREAYVKMKDDFGEDIPWHDWQSLRRRMNDVDVRTALTKNRAK
jgi:hypothetical protein